ncbi:MAG: OmpA family protein [Alloprevotella sp.]|nr:OmpA family protein [Alloprevotella sp.]
MKTKRFLMVALTLALMVPAFAQFNRVEKTDQLQSYMFLGLQGGAQTTFSNYNLMKLTMPMGAVSFGYMFMPEMGARLNVSGWRSKGVSRNIDKFYYYNAVTTDLDLLVNLSKIFSSNRNIRTNVYLLGGLGLTYGWHNEQLNRMVLAEEIKAPYAWRHRFFHNIRVGAGVEYNLTKRFSANFEVSFNDLPDRFNSKVSATGDKQLNALIGLTYKFGHKYVKVAPSTLPVMQEVIEDASAEMGAAHVSVDELSLKTETKDEQTETKVAIQAEKKPQPVAVTKREKVKLHKVIFYDIRMSDNEDPSAVLQQVADFMKQYKDVRVFAVGYADKGTGTPQLNAKYAQKRAQQFKEDLVNRYGVSAESITIDSKGDTVQPFDENDKNRCVIIDAEGVREYTVFE